MTRQQKSPKQRAQEALDVEERRVQKLNGQKTKAKTEFDRLSREFDAAVVRRDYLRLHPDLPKPTSRTTPTTSTAGGTTA